MNKNKSIAMIYVSCINELQEVLIILRVLPIIHGKH